MFNKGKIALKYFLYFVAAILLCVCVYIFIKYVPITYVEGPQKPQIVVERDSSQTEESLKKATDTKTAEPCEDESFWAKYNIWGDTGTVYRPSESDEAATKKMDESISCDESFEHNALFMKKTHRH